MGDIANIVLGVAVGIVLLTLVLCWAFRPRPRKKKSWLAPPSGYDGDGGMPPGGFSSGP